MQKLIILLLSVMTMNTAMANYTVTIGQGLPKESIKFVNNTPSEPEVPPEPPKVPECAPFNYSNSYSFWQDISKQIKPQLNWFFYLDYSHFYQ